MRTARTLQMTCRYLAATTLALVLCSNSIAGAVDSATSAEAGGSAFLLATYKAAANSGGAVADGDMGVAGSAGTAGTSKFKWQSSRSIAGSRVWSRFVDLSPTGINIRLPLN